MADLCDSPTVIMGAGTPRDPPPTPSKMSPSMPTALSRAKSTIFEKKDEAGSPAKKHGKTLPVGNKVEKKPAAKAVGIKVEKKPAAKGFPKDIKKGKNKPAARSQVMKKPSSSTIMKKPAAGKGSSSGKASAGSALSKKPAAKKDKKVMKKPSSLVRRGSSFLIDMNDSDNELVPLDSDIDESEFSPKQRFKRARARIYEDFVQMRDHNASFGVHNVVDFYNYLSDNLEEQGFGRISPASLRRSFPNVEN